MSEHADLFEYLQQKQALAVARFTLTGPSAQLIQDLSDWLHDLLKIVALHEQENGENPVDAAAATSIRMLDTLFLLAKITDGFQQKSLGALEGAKALESLWVSIIKNRMDLGIHGGVFLDIRKQSYFELDDVYYPTAHVCAQSATEKVFQRIAKVANPPTDLALPPFPIQSFVASFDELTRFFQCKENLIGISEGSRILTAMLQELVAILKTWTTPTKPSEPVPQAAPLNYVDLDQIAAAVNRSKSALEKLKSRKANPLPDPDVPGGGGKKDEWVWSKIRPWLEKEFSRQLNETCPQHFR